VTDIGLVLAKLAALQEQVTRMERRRSADLETFRTDLDRQDALAMSLLVALQEAADIALHIASDEGWGLPSSYADAFQLLARQGLIDVLLATKLANIASLRNRVAHGYASLDFERLWKETPDGIEAFRQYSARIAAHVGSAVPRKSS
jgi:uncharacterized protein YutE (UPF0331/DUF86 family)